MNKYFQPGESPYLPLGADGEAHASAKVEMEIGKLISRTVQRSLRTIAFITDCELQMDVDKGWLTDSIRIRVTGTGRAVVAFANKLEAYRRQLE